MDKQYNDIQENITGLWINHIMLLRKALLPLIWKSSTCEYQPWFAMKPYNININYVDPDAYYNNLDQGDKCVN